MSSVSHSDLYSVTSSVVRTQWHYVTVHHRMIPCTQENKKDPINMLFYLRHFSRQITCNNKGTFNDNKKTPFEWRRIAHGWRVACSFISKDTKQYCNPRLWSREFKLGQMGRRVSVVRFRPPLHYNARWAGRPCAKNCYSGTSRKANRHTGWGWHTRATHTLLLIYRYNNNYNNKSERQTMRKGVRFCWNHAHVRGFTPIIQIINNFRDGGFVNAVVLL